MSANSFRALHDRDGLFVMPNPWDIGSARILAGLGFEALATTSAGMDFSLGLPEGSTTPEAVLDHCRMLVGATDLPVSADLEKGFGDSPESVAETIQAAAATGLAGGSIEDFTGDKANPIFDITLATERIAAACEARDRLAQDFVLTARCESMSYGLTDLDAVIERLLAYEAAGADVLYAPDLHDLASIKRVCEAVSNPVNVVMGLPGSTFSIGELAEAGVKRISVGAAFFRVAYGAMIGAAREVLDQKTFTKTQSGVGFAELDAFFKPYA